MAPAVLGGGVLPGDIFFFFSLDLVNAFSSSLLFFWVLWRLAVLLQPSTVV